MTPSTPGRSFFRSHLFPGCFQQIHPTDPVVQRVRPDFRFLLGSQPLRRFRHRLSCGCPSFRSGVFIQADFSSRYRLMLPVRPLCSTGVYPASRQLLGPSLPDRAPVINSRCTLVAFAPIRQGLLGSSADLPTRAVLNNPEGLMSDNACCFTPVLSGSS